jgi:hypothetical protein
VCRSDQPTAVLQKAIDFSCGDGADCSAILEGGACNSPDTVASHCSWAVNSYYQNNKAKGATCDFDGAATVSTTDPSNFTASSSTPAGLRFPFQFSPLPFFHACQVSQGALSRQVPGTVHCLLPASSLFVRSFHQISHQVPGTQTNNTIVCSCNC